MSIRDSLQSLYGEAIIFWKKVRNQPDRFDFVESDDSMRCTLNGQPVVCYLVGPEKSVVHMTLHDVAEHAINWAMTEERYRNKSPANAVHVTGKFERLGQLHGKTYFQPVVVIPTSQ